MLYDEADISKNAMRSVLACIKGPACLLGGWAVYLATNARYSQEHGRDYHGSKDIDLGFHFSGSESAELVRQSALAESVRELGRIGFAGTASRMSKAYHRETGGELGPKEAKKVPGHDLFYLYVDPIVDEVPSTFRDAMGFWPIDEPLLKAVFEGGQCDRTRELGSEIALPKPAVLLASKIAALPGREKDHKRHKDIADIYALLWYSETPLAGLRSGALGLVPAKEIRGALSGISDAEYRAAAGAIGVDAGSLKRTFGAFADSC